MTGLWHPGMNCAGLWSSNSQRKSGKEHSDQSVGAGWVNKNRQKKHLLLSVCFARRGEHGLAISLQKEENCLLGYV